MTKSNSLIVISATNSISVVVCLLATFMVCALKLYRKVVYRLALYQVLASLAFAINLVLDIVFINYDDDSDVYNGLCTAIGWLVQFSVLMKVLFAMWVAFHLFCFGVLHKNLRKLEVLYVVSSLLVPAIVAMVPLATRTYGINSLGDCWIAVTNRSSPDIVTIERFSLWMGPAMAILFVSSAAMIVLVIKLTHRVLRQFKREPITDNDQFWKALKQLLPLAAFPIFLCVFLIPSFFFYLYLAVNPSAETEALSLATAVSFSLWSLSSGVALIVHVCMARTYNTVSRPHKHEHENATVKTEIRVSEHSTTSFPKYNSIILDM